MKQTITLKNRMHIPLPSQPIRQGVPWPRGAVHEESTIGAMDQTGSPVPAATRVLNRWPDGSIQWMLVDLAVDFAPSDERTIELGPDVPPAPSPATCVRVVEDKRALTVTNGLLELSFSTTAGSIVNRWTCEGRSILRENGFDVTLTDKQDLVYSARAGLRRCFVEEANPLRAVVRVEGKHAAADGKTLLDYWLRFTVTAGRPDVAITYHYHNIEDYAPDLEGTPEALLRSMSLEFQTAMLPDCERAILHSARGRDTRPEYYRLCDDLEICAADNMDLARYEELHQAKGITGGGAGRVFIRDESLLRDDPMKKPWYVRRVVDFKFGSINHPEAGTASYLGLLSAAGSLVAAGAAMIGLHPKSLSVTGATLRYDVWPRWAGVMDVTEGEGRTIDFHLGALPPNATDEQVVHQYFAWESGIYAHLGVHPTVSVALDPEHVRRCAVFNVEKLPAFDPQGHFAFERKVNAQWTPAQGIPTNGHWHYGDSDDEGTYDPALGFNNQEMWGSVWFQDYLRTGRPECLERGLALAQHLLDVDLVAHSSDPFRNGGMCAHGPRHNHCAAYPSHMWFTELLFAYALTGDREYLEGARRGCDNLSFWVEDPHGFEVICGDGREAGQPLINLAWAYEFLPEPRYLAAMNKVVREGFMAKVARHGRLTYMKPREDMPLVRYDGYGEWAAWEGLFWVWQVTKDDALRRFLLEQFEWRLTEARMATSGGYRATDYNAAAYAWYLTGDRQWLDRVARAFRVSFRCVDWPFAWIKSMYYIKLAFEHGIVKDDDVFLA